MERRTDRYKLELHLLQNIELNHFIISTCFVWSFSQKSRTVVLYNPESVSWIGMRAKVSKKFFKSFFYL